MPIFSFFNQLDYSYQIFLISVFALIFGSFASLISHRLVNKEPIIFTRSKCLKCGYLLKPQNLVPLFSWLFQGGKCSNCKEKISIRYPLIEFGFLLIFLTILYGLKFTMDWKMILYFLIAFTLIIMCIVDLEAYFIPNSTQYFLTILVTILLLLNGENGMIISAVTSGFAYLGFGIFLSLFFYFTTSMEAIGVDDLKFFFIAGLMLGINNFLSFMMVSGFLGIIFGSIWQKITKEETFPFAPAICGSAFLCLLFGELLNPMNIIEKLIF